MINHVVLTGRLTADPELRHTSKDVPVTSFSIAVNRRYRVNQEVPVDFINIVAWRNTAEFVTKHFKKGYMISIIGSIQTRQYVDKDTGKNRKAFDVVANEVQFVESTRVATGEKGAESEDVEIADVALAEFEDVTDVGEIPF